MGRIVIVAYKPKSGMTEELVQLIEAHWPMLHNEGLVSERKPVVMRAADGSMIEVFEWASADAISAAHGNAAVNEMWARFAEVCEFMPIAEVPEAARLFSEFAAVN